MDVDEQSDEVSSEENTTPTEAELRAKCKSLERENDELKRENAELKQEESSEEMHAQSTGSSRRFSETRASGMWFEAYTAAQLKKFAQTEKKNDADVIFLHPNMETALKGAEVYAPWSDVPAWALVSFDWLCRDETERKRIYEGPRDARGWREYGGDGLAVRCDVLGALLMIQCKDRLYLRVGNLGTFIAASEDVGVYNHKTLGLPEDTPSGVLCYPTGSRISERDAGTLKKMQGRRGIYQAEFPKFEERLAQRLAEVEARRAADPGTSSNAVEEPLGGSCSVLADQVAPPISTAPTDPSPIVAPSTTVTDDGKGNEHELAYEEAMPKDGAMRPFQISAAAKIVKGGHGLYLVKAPPGCGKTAIVVTVVNALITKVQQTRGQAGEKHRVAILTAPFIDHARQLFDRLAEGLQKAFGVEWSKVARFVGDVTACTSIEDLAADLENGVRIFVSTDRSAERLYMLAVMANKKGHQLVCVKDEAHYNSRNGATSTALLELARDSEGYGVACTATPNAAVRGLKDLKTALDLTLQDAIAAGYCAEYTIVLPLLTTVDEGMPVEAAKLAERGGELAVAALFVVQGMMNDGKRRCVAYARNKDDATTLSGYLQEACDFHGVGCFADVVTEDIDAKDRQSLYNAFLKKPTHEHKPGVLGEANLTRPILRFLIGVMILDQCVDLPQCDSVLIASPPTSICDNEAEYRTIQRLGRATRPKPGNRGSALYLFTGHSNEWLHQFFHALAEFDPHCAKRVRVASSNPVTAYSKPTATREKSTLAEMQTKYSIGSTRVNPQQWVDVKVRALAAKCSKKRPTTDISITDEDKDVDGDRLLPAGVPAFTFTGNKFVDGILPDFANDGKGGGGVLGVAKTHLSNEQKQYLLEKLCWLKGAIDAYIVASKKRAAIKDIDMDCKLGMVAARFPTNKPTRVGDKSVTITDKDDIGKQWLPVGVPSFTFNPAKLVEGIVPNFANDDEGDGKATIRASRMTLSKEQKDYFRANVTWLEEAVKKYKEDCKKKLVTTDNKLAMLVTLHPKAKPSFRTKGRPVTPEDEDAGGKRLLPDGVSSFTFNAGRFVADILPTLANATIRASKTFLSEDQKQYLRANLSWLEEAVKTHKEDAKTRAESKAARKDAERCMLGETAEGSSSTDVPIAKRQKTDCEESDDEKSEDE